MSIFSAIGKWFPSDRPMDPNSLQALNMRVDTAIEMQNISDHFRNLPTYVRGPLAAFLQDTVNAPFGKEPTLEQAPYLKYEIDHDDDITVVLFKSVVDEISRMAAKDHPALMEQLHELVRDGYIAEAALAYKSWLLKEALPPIEQKLLPAPEKPVALLAPGATCLTS